MRTPTRDPGRPTAASVRAMRDHDGGQVLAILAQGPATGTASFETSTPAWADWDARHLPGPRLVAVESGTAEEVDRLLGWAALSPVSDRCADAGVAEVSVYVAQATRGRGVGRRLLAELVQRSVQAGLWTLQAGIFPDNAPSLAVHRATGFRLAGRRERLGQLGGVWRDVLLLERRSTTAGT